MVPVHPCTLATTQVFFFASLLNERSTVIQINLLLEQTIHDSEFECSDHNNHIRFVVRLTVKALP